MSNQVSVPVPIFEMLKDTPYSYKSAGLDRQWDIIYKNNTVRRVTELNSGQVINYIAILNESYHNGILDCLVELKMNEGL